MSFAPCLLHTFFFLKVPPTTEIYPLSLHDALPIFLPDTTRAVPRQCREGVSAQSGSASGRGDRAGPGTPPQAGDRKSTRLNSSHTVISYAVFCLKKKITQQQATTQLQSLCKEH